MDKNEDRRYPIGDVARRTGLAVSAVRFYSDEGIVRPAGTNSAGHRLYDLHTIAQLELIRTLRELGAGLEEIRRLLTGETELRYLLAEHLELVEQQGKDLLARRAVLRTLVRLEHPAEQAALLHKLVTMPDAERERLVDAFWSEVAADLPGDFGQRLATMRPTLSPDPTAAQLEAWIELADLLQDNDFRAEVREYLRAVHGEGPGVAMSAGPVQDMIHGPGAEIVEAMLAARRSGLAPEADHAQDLARRLSEQAGLPFGVQDSPECRLRLAEAFRMLGPMPPDLADPQYEATHGRYLALVAVINGTQPVPPLDEQEDLAGLSEWIAAALQASAVASQ
ncbi:helix-turn-helix domain-containing protein [Kineosporia babensis]|uniref:MerR family transcriptional regulator n=1 Tax=Kineosporia babensis TaxID=499548 RepID=A0A9X1NHD9_9ACTN|nr:MerR family transcriptional regulator [Kineosporia babensis]MCD5315122.1 MerR family transcriptional regulator [Kineosporia babensis]